MKGGGEGLLEEADDQLRLEGLHMRASKTVCRVT